MLLQRSLLDEDAPQFGPIDPTRTPLAGGAWVDHQPAWLTGSADLFDTLASDVDWRADRRQMYDNVVDVPRLTHFFGAGDPLPHPLVAEARERLSAHYAAELGEPLTTCGMCLYRDGRDSVAWHGDRNGRSADHDTVVAILSLGTPRTLALRPRAGGGTRHRFALGDGDLLVMGGSCQRTWDHGIAKTSASVGPRISIQFRTRGVR